MAHHQTTQRCRAILIGAALTALALAPAAGAGAPGAEIFEGACELSGVIRHQPPLTEQPAPTEIHGRFSGTCSGTLTDSDGRTHQLDAAPARYDVRDAGGALSCLGGVATGTGSLRFGGGRDIDFTLTERRPGPGLAVVTLDGAARGVATVFGTVSQDVDLVRANERCNGRGLRFVEGDARLVSPGISG